MEGERRKRKMEKEVESEEEQMEKFFALIKSTKNARDRLSKEKEEERAKGVWKPTFEAEDFMDDEELKKLNVLHQRAGPSSGKETKEEEAAEPQAQKGNNKKPSDDDLDLTLSL
ncbi:protein NIM1-INTERACTING 3 [Cajanus cajan]|uniref:protein NIM1-INTERACTING 3 n=1 Tax=Cajanus cajan TaxID=3821 RepID=UPI00098DBC04|nr:protein NIM1-INTERACTING 3 [Cajanus cajan]